MFKIEIFCIPDKAKPFVRGRRKANGSSDKIAGLPKDTLSGCPAFFIQGRGIAQVEKGGSHEYFID
jgi:hypothetical protein